MCAEKSLVAFQIDVHHHQNLIVYDVIVTFNGICRSNFIVYIVLNYFHPCFHVGWASCTFRMINRFFAATNCYSQWLALTNKGFMFYQQLCSGFGCLVRLVLTGKSRMKVLDNNVLVTIYLTKFLHLTQSEWIYKIYNYL